MNQELEDRLYNEFPKLYPASYKHFLGFECADGWFELIWELSKKITPLLEDNPENPMFAEQVKEKMGTLRFYMSYDNRKIANLIDEYEDKSAHICEVCGKPGKTYEGRWVRTVCNEHQ